jgi:hypothetical protein
MIFMTKSRQAAHIHEHEHEPIARATREQMLHTAARPLDEGP